MPKEEGTTFCIACNKPLLFAQLFSHNEMAMWCNNPECNRFGLLTVVSTPTGEVETLEEEANKKG